MIDLVIWSSLPCKTHNIGCNHQCVEHSNGQADFNLWGTPWTNLAIGNQPRWDGYCSSFRSSVNASSLNALTLSRHHVLPIQRCDAGTLLKFSSTPSNSYKVICPHLRWTTLLNNIIPLARLYHSKNSVDWLKIRLSLISSSSRSLLIHHPNSWFAGNSTFIALIVLCGSWFGDTFLFLCLQYFLKNSGVYVIDPWTNSLKSEVAISTAWQCAVELEPSLRFSQLLHPTGEDTTSITVLGGRRGELALVDIRLGRVLLQVRLLVFPSRILFSFIPVIVDLPSKISYLSTVGSGKQEFDQLVFWKTEWIY